MRGGSHNVDLRHVDNVSMVVGSDPIAALEDYVVDVLGGKFDYLDLSATSYDTGTGQVTGNITFGDSIWTVAVGSAYVRTLPGSSFPYLEVPGGSYLSQDVAGTFTLEGTNRESTQYFLDQFLVAAGVVDTFVYYIAAGPRTRFANNSRFMDIITNTMDTGLVPNSEWHVTRRRIRYNAGVPVYEIATGTTFDATSDTYVTTAPVSGVAPARCERIYGANNPGNKSLIAANITVYNDTVVAGTDDTIKTLVRNATKLALLGGIWPT
jgi:hypothetical protein